MDHRPPSTPLSLRFTRFGIVIVMGSALIVVVALSLGGIGGVVLTVLGAIGIAMGLFLAVTAGFRIGPGRRQFPQP